MYSPSRRDRLNHSPLHMSSDSQTQPAFSARSERRQAARDAPQPGSRGRFSPPFGLGSGLTTLGGGALTGLAVAGFLTINSPSQSAFDLEQVAIAEIATAAQSLVAAQAAALVDEAKNC